MLHTFHYDKIFRLESGNSLSELTVAYHTYGTLNEDKSNVVWICHALTASADVADWWQGLVGNDCVINPKEHFIVCANILGSCYGTTGPESTNRTTGRPFYTDFPAITIRDITKAHLLLKQHLAIEKIKVLIGGSMGGYQALEWVSVDGGGVDRLVLLATSAKESAWGIAIHTAQRLAIEADNTFGSPVEKAGWNGLKAARAIGMLTYRNYELINQQQTDDNQDKTDNFKVSAYINYQGEKLANRFSAYSYWTLTKAMDTHNLARKRATGVGIALAGIRQQTLLIGISSDVLCPAEEQRFIAAYLPNCRYEEIDSMYGHDGFLIETKNISALLKDWLV